MGRPGNGEAIALYLGCPRQSNKNLCECKRKTERPGIASWSDLQLSWKKGGGAQGGYVGRPIETGKSNNQLSSGNSKLNGNFSTA